MSPMAKVFELNHKGLNVPRALVVLGVMVVPLIVLGVIGKEQYCERRVRGAVRGLERPRR